MKSPKMVAGAVALGLIAAACGGDDDDPVATGAAADNEATDAEAAATDEEMSDEEMSDESMDDEMSEEMDDMSDEEMSDEMDDMSDEMDDMSDDMMMDVTLFTVTVENISGDYTASSTGVFDTIDGGAEPGPAFPGDIYSFEVYANPGDRLSFATMLVQSNDWFFAPGSEGIDLYDADGNPISGDITDSVRLYDSGTEVDQVPGEGADQAPRQAGPDTGDADPDPLVRSVTEGVPAVAELVQVTVTPGENGLFTVSVQNISGNSALPGPIAPGVFVIHQDGEPIFTPGEADRGLGLEGLAEDGAAGPLAEAIGETTGVATPLAPGVWVATDGSPVLFEDGVVDPGYGLEALAEDGDPAALAAFLETADGVFHSGVFTTPDGADAPGPAFPGQSYVFEVPAAPGEYLNFATMFVQSNDLFFAPLEQGIPLFDAEGDPLTGDVTEDILLWDAGTEVDEVNGFGPNQAPRQAGPDTGADQDAMVFEVDTPTGAIRVTVELS